MAGRRGILGQRSRSRRPAGRPAPAGGRTGRVDGRELVPGAPGRSRGLRQRDPPPRPAPAGSAFTGVRGPGPRLRLCRDGRRRTGRSRHRGAGRTRLRALRRRPGGVAPTRRPGLGQRHVGAAEPHQSAIGAGRPGGARRPPAAAADAGRATVQLLGLHGLQRRGRGHGHGRRPCAQLDGQRPGAAQGDQALRGLRQDLPGGKLPPPALAWDAAGASGQDRVGPGRDPQGGRRRPIAGHAPRRGPSVLRAGPSGSRGQGGSGGHHHPQPGHGRGPNPWGAFP
jgi:hypothetical protein